MTNIATKNGSVVVKDGSVAENCNCCVGWYCYDNPCAGTGNNLTRRWICGENEIPPSTLSVRATFSGQKFCVWGFIGADPVPLYAFPITYDPSTRLNQTVTLARETVSILGAYVDAYPYSSQHTFPCAYVKRRNTPAASAEGLFELFVLPGNPDPGDAQEDWDCFADIGMWVDVYYNFDAKIPYSEYAQNNPQCSTSTAGTFLKTGLGSYTAPRGGVANYTTYRCDDGRFSQTNPTLSGVKWTLSWESHPICTLEVV